MPTSPRDEIGELEERLAKAMLDGAPDCEALSGLVELARERELLRWFVAQPMYQLVGSDEKGWTVWDQSHGLVVAGRGATAIEAIANVRSPGKARHPEDS